MGNSISRTLDKSELYTLANQTGFSIVQIQRLYLRFRKLDRTECGFLTKEDLLAIPELFVNPLGSRIIDAFFMNSGPEMDFTQFIETLSIFRNVVDGNDRCKLIFFFNIYDTNKTGTISLEDVSKIFHLVFGANISQDKLMHISNEVFLAADTKQIGRIDFEEFSKAIREADIGGIMSVSFKQ